MRETEVIVQRAGGETHVSFPVEESVPNADVVVRALLEGDDGLGWHLLGSDAEVVVIGRCLATPEEIRRLVQSAAHRLYPKKHFNTVFFPFLNHPQAQMKTIDREDGGWNMAIRLPEDFSATEVDTCYQTLAAKAAELMMLVPESINFQSHVSVEHCDQVKGLVPLRYTPTQLRETMLEAWQQCLQIELVNAA